MADDRTEQLRKRLLANVRLLPSGTSLRFAVLVVMIAASTGSVYSHLAILVRPQMDDAYRLCMAAAPAQPLPKAEEGLTPNRALDCAVPFASTIALSALLGVALVALVSLLIYLLTPWWKLRRRDWRPLGTGTGGRWQHRSWWMPSGKLSQDPEADAAAAAKVDELAARYGLRRDRDVKFLVDQGATDARTFGTRKKSFIVLPPGMVLYADRDPDAFTSTLLHELGHVYNRDNRPTYLTFATWRAFVAVVLAPYLLLSVEPRLFSSLGQGRPQDLRPQVPELQVLAAVAVLAGLVYLSRLAVARVRESHADTVAGWHDPDRTVQSALKQLERLKVPRRSVLFSSHPTPAQRLDALDDPALLYVPEWFVLFSTGVALALLGVNLTYLVTITSLSSWLGDSSASGKLADVAAGRAALSEFLLLPVALVGLTTLLLLGLISTFAAIFAWQRALAHPAEQGSRGRLSRLVLPLAAGMMLGEPLSIIYANAGTLGAFDTTVARRIIDVAISAVTLTIIVCVVFLWARECAAVWLPVTRGSLARMCAVTALTSTIGGAAVFLVWFTVHNTAGITQVSMPGALPYPLAGFPAARFVLGDYSALDYLPALPGNAVLMALPCLLVAAGALRRPPNAPPRWLPAEFAELAPAIQAPHPRLRAGRSVLIGVIVAVLGVEVALVLIELLRAVVGVRDVVATVLVGGVVYVGRALIWMTALVAAVAALIAARKPGPARFNAGLLAAFTAAAVATALMPGAHFIAICETLRYACYSSHVLGTTFGGYAAMGTARAAVLTVPLLLVGGLLIRTGPQPELPPPTAWSRAATAVALLLVLAGLAAGSWVFVSYYL